MEEGGREFKILLVTGCSKVFWVCLYERLNAIVFYIHNNNNNNNNNNIIIIITITQSIRLCSDTLFQLLNPMRSYEENYYMGYNPLNFPITLNLKAPSNLRRLNRPTSHFM